jgi:dimethylargininase
MKALVRRPSPRLDEGCVSHIERSAIDYPLAVAQWERYVQILREHGWEIVEVPPDDNSPDGVFVEDAAVMFGAHAVIARPGAPSRSAEPASVEPVLESLGVTIHHITAPGTLDGGDVLKVGATVYVGLGARTNAAGIEQLRAIVEPLGATVVAVPVTKALHLKSAVTALPDGTIIGWPDVVDDPSVFSNYLAMPEEGGAHVVLLGGDRLLMSSAAPTSAALLRELGYDPVVVDVGEYTKLEGCVTCLSIRLRT